MGLERRLRGSRWGRLVPAGWRCSPLDGDGTAPVVAGPRACTNVAAHARRWRALVTSVIKETRFPKMTHKAMTICKKSKTPV